MLARCYCGCTGEYIGKIETDITIWQTTNNGFICPFCIEWLRREFDKQTGAYKTIAVQKVCEHFDVEPAVDMFYDLKTKKGNRVVVQLENERQKFCMNAGRPPSFTWIPHIEDNDIDLVVRALCRENAFKIRGWVDLNSIRAMSQIATIDYFKVDGVTGILTMDNIFKVWKCKRDDKGVCPTCGPIV